MKFKDWWGKEHTLPNNTKVFWRPSAYGLILRNKRILLVKATMHGLWELPGGAIEMDETIPDALAREVSEETGYRITVVNKHPIHLEDNYFFAPDLNEYFRAIPLVFLAKPIGSNKKAKPRDSKEVEKVQWFALEKLPHPINPMVTRALKEYQK